MRLHLRVSNMPAWVEEFRWHPTRLWRFDFAWPGERVALEVEGGVWTRGRHNRPSGFIEDCEKYNEATADGWRVVRVTEELIESGRAVEWLQRLLACGVVPF